ncbi:hypothetical protein Tco_0441486 [Tanacetum coccineum]
MASSTNEISITAASTTFVASVPLFGDLPGSTGILVVVALMHAEQHHHHQSTIMKQYSRIKQQLYDEMHENPQARADDPKWGNAKKSKTDEETSSGNATSSSQPFKQNPLPTSSEQPKQHAAAEFKGVDLVDDSEVEI